jgi:hypothetical protein
MLRNQDGRVLRILELGSGSGLVSICLAALLSPLSPSSLASLDPAPSPSLSPSPLPDTSALKHTLYVTDLGELSSLPSPPLPPDLLASESLLTHIPSDRNHPPIALRFRDPSLASFRPSPHSNQPRSKRPFLLSLLFRARTRARLVRPAPLMGLLGRRGTGRGLGPSDVRFKLFLLQLLSKQASKRLAVEKAHSIVLLSPGFDAAWPM